MLGWHIVPTGLVPCPASSGRVPSLFSSLYQLGMRVPAVNTLITLGRMLQKKEQSADTSQQYSPSRQVEFSLTGSNSSCWRLHILFFEYTDQSN